LSKLFHRTRQIFPKITCPRNNAAAPTWSRPTASFYDLTQFANKYMALNNTASKILCSQKAKKISVIFVAHTMAFYAKNVRMLRFKDQRQFLKCVQWQYIIANFRNSEKFTVYHSGMRYMLRIFSEIPYKHYIGLYSSTEIGIE
jgi:hypothetical protein